MQTCTLHSYIDNDTIFSCCGVLGETGHKLDYSITLYARERNYQNVSTSSLSEPIARVRRTGDVDS